MATDRSLPTSRTRYPGRSPARAPIIKRVSSLSQHPSTSNSRSSYEQVADYESASYIQREGYSGPAQSSSEQVSILEERFIPQRGFEAGIFRNTANLPGTDSIQRGRNDITRQGINMATATMSPHHANAIPSHGMSSNAQAGHSAYNGAAGPMPSASMGTTQPKARGQRQVGDWVLGKTIGAGSMGKVKVVVHQHTREKVSTNGTF